MASEETDDPPRRWQRRETRRAAERARMLKHGAGVRRVYPAAILKRRAQASRKAE